MDEYVRGLSYAKIGYKVEDTILGKEEVQQLPEADKQELINNVRQLSTNLQNLSGSLSVHYADYAAKELRLLAPVQDKTLAAIKILKRLNIDSTVLQEVERRLYKRYTDLLYYAGPNSRSL